MQEIMNMTMILYTAGMDAQVSYGFHSERKKNPEKFKNQLTNQVFFGVFVWETIFFYPFLWLVIQKSELLARLRDVWMYDESCNAFVYAGYIC